MPKCLRGQRFLHVVLSLIVVPFSIEKCQGSQKAMTPSFLLRFTVLTRLTWFYLVSYSVHMKPRYCRFLFNQFICELCEELKKILERRLVILSRENLFFFPQKRLCYGFKIPIKFDGCLDLWNPPNSCWNFVACDWMAVTFTEKFPENLYSTYLFVSAQRKNKASCQPNVTVRGAAHGLQRTWQLVESCILQTSREKVEPIAIQPLSLSGNQQPCYLRRNEGFFFFQGFSLKEKKIEKENGWHLFSFLPLSSIP